MIQPVEKFKFKTWHKVVLGILVAFFGLMAIAVNSAPSVPAATDPVLVREKAIEKGFSEWDGAHIKLKALVKKNMNDPDSFEYVEGNYFDRDSFIIVNMTYRGKNAFGGKVLESVKAKCSIDGEVIEIMQ